MTTHNKDYLAQPSLQLSHNNLKHEKNLKRIHTHTHTHTHTQIWGFPGGTVVKNPSANAGDAKDVGLILEWGRSPGRGSDNPRQYSWLENSMDRGAWRATVHGATKSRT